MTNMLGQLHGDDCPCTSCDEAYLTQMEPVATVRTFTTGATRDLDTTKPDYEGFNCPLVERSFGAYMTTHRLQADGSVRDSDNWQRGIPRDAYMKSLMRHVHDLWLHHRGWETDAVDHDIESVLCAIRFNVNGYLHEHLKAQRQSSSGGGETP